MNPAIPVVACSSRDDAEGEEIQELWFDEAEHRINEYRAGSPEAVVADQIFREAEDQLR